MDKPQKLLLVNIPTGKCNFRCPYCFITQVHAWDGTDERFERTPEEIGRAFATDRFGGPCYVNLCSKGETLIYPQAVDALEQILLQGHYVEVVTNGSLTQRFEAISRFSPELLQRLSFKFSFHYTELVRLNLIDTFFDNVLMMKNAGASFTVELTPFDGEEPLIDEIKALCAQKLKALCHCTIARDDRKPNIPVLSKHSLDEYCDVWSTFASPMLSFKKEVFQQRREEFCYAGKWSLYINLFSGAIQKCYKMKPCGNLYDLESPLDFEAIGFCPLSHCYNAHALMTFGLLPDVDTPHYDEMRNRVCSDGTEWLSPSVKSFFHGKLSESNEEYTDAQKAELIKKGRRAYARLRFKRSLIRKAHGLVNLLPEKQAGKVRARIRKFKKKRAR